MPNVRALSPKQWAAVAVGTVGLILLAFLVSRLLISEPATLSLNASPGGNISPDGNVTRSVGDEMTISVWSEDPASSPGLIVDGQPVPLVVGDDNRSAYTFTVAGDHVLSATFAELADTAVPLDVDTATAIQTVAPDGSSVTFTTATPLVESLEPGDVLTNGVPAETREVPLLVKVVEVRPQPDGSVLVISESAELTDFVRNASVAAIMPSAFDPADDAQAALTPAAPPQGGLDATGASAHAGFSHDWGNMTLAGDLDISSPEAEIAFEISFFSIDTFSATIRQSSSGSMSLSGRSATAVEGEITVLDRDLLTMGIPLGPVVVPVTLHVEAGGGIEAAAAAGMLLRGELSVSLEAGVAWDGNGWRPVAEANPQVETTVELDATAQARAHVVLRPSLLVAGLCGPYFEVQLPFLELTADMQADPWWELYGGVNLSGGAECSFGDGDFTFASGDIMRNRLADAGGPLLAAAATPNPTRTATPTPAPTVERSSHPGLTVDLRPVAWRGDEWAGAPDREVERTPMNLLGTITNERTDQAAVVRADWNVTIGGQPISDDLADSLVEDFYEWGDAGVTIMPGIAQQIAVRTTEPHIEIEPELVSVEWHSVRAGITPESVVTHFHFVYDDENDPMTLSRIEVDTQAEVDVATTGCVALVEPDGVADCLPFGSRLVRAGETTLLSLDPAAVDLLVTWDAQDGVVGGEYGYFPNSLLSGDQPALFRTDR